MLSHNQNGLLNMILEWGKTHIMLPANNRLLQSLEEKMGAFPDDCELENFLMTSLEDIKKQVDLAKTTLSDAELITATEEDSLWGKALDSFKVFDRVVYLIEATYYLIAPYKKDLSRKILMKLDEIMLEIIAWLDEGNVSSLRLTVLNDVRRRHLKQIPEEDWHQFPWYEIYANYPANILDMITENFDTFLSNDVDLIPETLKPYLPEIWYELKRDRALFATLNQLSILHKRLLAGISRRSAVALFQLGEDATPDYLVTPRLEEAGLIRTSVNIVKDITSVTHETTDKAYGLFLAAFCGPGLQDKERLALLNTVEDLVTKIDTTKLTGNTADVLTTLKRWFDGKCEDAQVVSVSFDTWINLLEKKAERMKPMEYDEDVKEFHNAIHALLGISLQPEPPKDSWLDNMIERVTAGIDLIARLQSPCLQPKWLHENTETTGNQIFLEIQEKIIRLSMKPDVKGLCHILPYPDEIFSCKEAEDYKILWKFVGKSENYWGGCTLTSEYKPEIFPAQQIKKRIFCEVESAKYKKAIIGISGKKEDIDEFVRRLQKYSIIPEKGFEKLLNIVVLIISFERGAGNA